MTAPISTKERGLTAHDMARELEAFARHNGFVASDAYYILGEFNLRADDGSIVYSDEGHLWCKGCATTLLKLASSLMPGAERCKHFVCMTSADGEDSCPHCMKCGETLNGSISAHAVAEELEHYDEYPIGAVNPRQAVEIAMVLWAAPESHEALSLGRAALSGITPAGRRALSESGPE